MRLFHVYLPKIKSAQALKAGLGGGIGIFCLALMTSLSGSPLLMAPFGASCVLLFSAPASPLSQPINVIGGHFVSSLVGVILGYFFGPDPWVLALSVFLAISLMAYFRVIHPPAGADPLVIIMTGESAQFLLFPVLPGSILLVVIAIMFHRMNQQVDYPLSKV